MLCGLVPIFSAVGKPPKKGRDSDILDGIYRNAGGRVARRVTDETTDGVSYRYLASRFLFFLFVICDKNEEEKCSFLLAPKGKTLTCLTLRETRSPFI